MATLKEKAAAAAGIQPDGSVYTVPDIRAVMPDAEPVEVPDVNDSPNMADPGASVFAAWSRVMADVQWVGKTREKGSQLTYAFRGIDAVLNAVGPVLRKHGVVVIPVRVEPEFTVIMTAKGNPMNYCRATVIYAIFGPAGDRMPVDGASLGEAFDSGDKAGVKAQSVALRTFYINALAIPTNQPQLDPEYGPQHELAAPKPPTVEEYYREIVKPTVTVPRLRQIRGELDAHPDIAQTLVDNGEGGQMTLIKLLVAVGTEKASAGK